MSSKRVIIDKNKVIEKYEKFKSISKVAYVLQINQARVRETLVKCGYKKIEGKNIYKKCEENL